MADQTALKEQVAVVTGGGAGIGQACALSLARDGADVVVADIDPLGCDDTVARVRALGGRALSVPTDMMDVAAIDAMLDAAERAFGRVDILVNNVGGVKRRDFLTQNERSWRRHIDLNLISMLAATSAAAPLIIRGGQGGAIVNVTSSEGARAAPGFAVYAACKAAMISFTKSMALELAEYGIRVNAIAPDHTITPGSRGGASALADSMTDDAISEAQRDAMGRLIPLGREGTAAECGEVVAFLCSAAARYVTGVTMPVDGGTAAAGGWHRDASGAWIQIHGRPR